MNTVKGPSSLPRPPLPSSLPAVATGLDLVSSLSLQVFLLFLPSDGFTNKKVIVLNPGYILQSPGELSKILLPRPTLEILAWSGVGPASARGSDGEPALPTVLQFHRSYKWYHSKQPASSALR